MVLIYWDRVIGRALKGAWAIATNGAVALIRTFVFAAAAAVAVFIFGGIGWAPIVGFAIGLLAFFVICFLCTLFYVPAEQDQKLRTKLSDLKAQKRDIDLIPDIKNLIAEANGLLKDTVFQKHDRLAWMEAAYAWRHRILDQIQDKNVRAAVSGWLPRKDVREAGHQVNRLLIPVSDGIDALEAHLSELEARVDARISSEFASA